MLHCRINDALCAIQSASGQTVLKRQREQILPRQDHWCQFAVTPQSKRQIVSQASQTPNPKHLWSLRNCATGPHDDAEHDGASGDTGSWNEMDASDAGYDGLPRTKYNRSPNHMRQHLRTTNPTAPKSEETQSCNAPPNLPKAGCR